MRELWRSLLDDKTLAVRVLRTVALIGVLVYMGDPEQLQDYLVMILGGGAVGMLGAGQPNPTRPARVRKNR